MALVESGPEIAVFEGELMFDDGDEGNEACEEFEKALEGLRRSGVKIPIVDLARVTAVSAKPAELLFTMWLDLIGEGRAFVLLAQDHVWEMLGRAAVDQMLVKRPAGAALLREGYGGPASSVAPKERWRAAARIPRGGRSTSGDVRFIGRPQADEVKENRDAAARIAR